jgi:hypothetical protein
MAKTTVTWRVPVGIRSAIDAESARSSLTPSAVVTNILRAAIQDYIDRWGKGDASREPVSRG